MDFNIRAIYFGESVALDERTDASLLLGTSFEFRSGISVPIRFPTEISSFVPLGDPSIWLPGLFKWTRLYQYPSSAGAHLDVLSAADEPDGSLRFRLVEMLQVPGTRRGPRPPVQFLGVKEMNHTECASWLVDLAETWVLDAEASKQRLVLSRPRLPRPRAWKFAWIGPDLVGSSPMKSRLIAIGRVYGAEIVHVLPYSFPQVRARLNEEMPLAAAIIARHYAPHINESVAPSGLNPGMVLLCDSVDKYALEQQITSWIEISVEQIEASRMGSAGNEKHRLLILMLKGMMSHSKIGQNMHCDRTTVLTAIRARRLNTPMADEILDANCAQYQETKESDSLFLWKDHNEGRRYFLNPKRVEYIKTLIHSE